MKNEATREIPEEVRKALKLEHPLEMIERLKKENTELKKKLAEMEKVFELVHDDYKDKLKSDN